MPEEFVPGPPPAEQEQEPGGMPYYEATLAQASNAGIKAAIDHRPTITEQLLHQKAYHEAELERINAALQHALNNVPTMALLDAIAKTGIHRR